MIIVGAGVVGLTLAHALEKVCSYTLHSRVTGTKHSQNGISYQILERDLSIDSRGNGWGITIHWARQALQSCIPEHMYNSLDTISVDPNMKSKDPGHYKFFNLESVERKFAAPVDPERMRVKREGFRKLLLSDLNVKWATQVKDIALSEDSISVTLEDSSVVKGRLLVGADGSKSVTRRVLCPQNSENLPIPIRFLGLVAKLTPEVTHSITDNIDPLTFQGCHPKTGVYMFWCLVSVPEINKSISTATPYYEVQICVSWPPKEGEPDLPASAADKVRLMRKMCSDMGQPIKDMVDSIPDDSSPIEVKLQDWPCLDWDNHGGKATLAGDSCHAMTMCKFSTLLYRDRQANSTNVDRGEAANFGIVDASELAEAILSFTKNGHSQVDAIAEYERKLRVRSSKGVLASRQACMDAHDYANLTAMSPLLHNR